MKARVRGEEGALGVKVFFFYQEKILELEWLW